jgi:RNA polymerase sigma-70 factor (ECF subfamily)
VPRGDDLDALIARAQAGDVRAFEALLAEHLGQVRRFARAFAATDAEADDLAQEALIKVYKSLRLFRYQSAFSSWLYAVVRNVYIDSSRSRAGRERAREDSLQPEHLGALPPAETPERLLDREQEKARMWRALRQVPLEFRGALVLFDIEGCSYDEVAAVEGVAVGTVKSRLSRGRAHLRRLLGQREESEAGGEAAPEGAGTRAQAASSHRPGSGT